MTPNLGGGGGFKLSIIRLFAGGDGASYLMISIFIISIIRKSGGAGRG